MTEVKSAPLTTREYPGYVVNELRQLRVRIDNDAAAFLVQSVGQDLRALSAAASQLANDFGGQPVTTEMVKQYFGGRAEAKSFTVADHTLMGRTSKALEELRWALDRGTAPVLVSSAMSTGLRSLAKFKSAPRGSRDADLMREVGVPGWKLRPPRAGARVGARRHRRRDPGGRPCRRRRQGPGQRPVLRAGADGALCRPVCAARASESTRTRKTPHPRGRRFVELGSSAQRDAACLFTADLRLAAWFLWMTPLEAALSSAREASAAAFFASSSPPVDGLAELAHSRLQRRLDRLVALVRSVVLLVALDLGLDVRHGGCLSLRAAIRM